MTSPLGGVYTQRRGKKGEFSEVRGYKLPHPAHIPIGTG
jgi:hypothetical protein